MNNEVLVRIVDRGARKRAPEPGQPIEKPFAQLTVVVKAQEEEAQAKETD